MMPEINGLTCPMPPEPETKPRREREPERKRHCAMCGDELDPRDYGICSVCEELDALDDDPFFEHLR
jgi:hypothetical protein